MELRNIYSFIKVAELNSFSKAAQALGYTQSNVTMQIKQLENELNTTLFDRIGRNILLTESGKIFLQHVIQISNSVTSAKHAVSSPNKPTGELKIGILESLCITYMPQIIKDYHNKYPEVNTIIKIGTFEELSSMLNSNVIDLLWTFDNPINNEYWIKEFNYPDKINVIAPSAHTIFQTGKVQLSSISNESFIFTEKTCSYRNVFQNILDSSETPYSIFMEIGNTEIIKKFVSSGLCLSVLPHFTIQNEVNLGLIKPLNLPEFELIMYGQIFYHKNKWITPAITEFIQCIKKLIN